MEKYFVIRAGEDGVRISSYTKAQLLKELKLDADDSDVFLNSENFDSDPNYWGTKTLIIKGEIVTPIVKKIVEEYDIQ